MRKLLRAGDVLVITKLDRLGRSVLDLIQLANDFQEKGVELEVLSGTFNRSDPMGKAFFTVAAAFAELERDLIQARTLDGLAAARARGRKGGRKMKLSPAQANEVRRMYAAKDKTVKEIGALFGITRESVYRYVRAALLAHTYTHHRKSVAFAPQTQRIMRNSFSRSTGR